MADLVRDAPIGQLLRWLTSNRYLQYAEEVPGFEIPASWTRRSSKDSDSGSSSDNVLASGAGASHAATNSVTQNVDEADETATTWNKQRTSFTRCEYSHDEDAFAVDWYGKDDPDNPYNWSPNKRHFVTFIICLYTFVVYMSSSVYINSTKGVMERFDVNIVQATIGLSLYVLGYGVGPLIFSPLSEIPSIGRNPIYIITMVIFVVVSIPAALASSFGELIALRFLQGFFGSPCLASGGASVGDIYSFQSLPYAMLAWVSAAYCGREFLPFIYEA